MGKSVSSLSLPATNRLVVSLYIGHPSPTATLRLVYTFSRSMRGAIAEALEAFGAGNEVLATSFLSERALPGCDIESDLLRAAGSMAGMVIVGRCPFDADLINP